MNARKPDIIELAHVSFALVILGNDWSVRNTKTICEFGFASTLFGISSQHSDSDSQLGANRRKTKVNLG
ncbi:MAG: hypothetical protein DME93_03620 [Verrucomicrobia bacterium]|nr:MAG: hypothetical protein DME93_03620 [Verrucomicrobiota bacterium]